jgi:hypothetical protein
MAGQGYCNIGRRARAKDAKKAKNDKMTFSSRPLHELLLVW